MSSSKSTFYSLNPNKLFDSDICCVGSLATQYHHVPSPDYHLGDVSAESDIQNASLLIRSGPYEKLITITILYMGFPKFHHFFQLNSYIQTHSTDHFSLPHPSSFSQPCQLTNKLKAATMVTTRVKSISLDSRVNALL